MGILQQLRAGTGCRKTIKFPGSDHLVDLKILSDQEEQDAEFAAETLFSAAKITIAFNNIEELQLEKTTQKLYRALREVGTNSPIEPDIITFKRNLTRIERDLLVDEMNAFYEVFNPSPRDMPIEELDALLTRLKKKPQETISSATSFNTLKRLALYLAGALLNSPEGNGSTSSQ